MTKVTKEQAQALFDTKWWEHVTPREAVAFQLSEPLLCMPWSRFQELTEKVLGRSVWTHEFARPELLRAELSGERQPPTFQEILGQLPQDKLVVIAAPEKSQ